MRHVIEWKEGLEIEPACGALTAVVLIVGLTMSSILIAAVVLFNALRNRVGNGKSSLD